MSYIYCHISGYIPEAKEKYSKQQFSFLKYNKRDGEWIDEGEILCFVVNEDSYNRSSFKPAITPKSGYLEHIKIYGEPLNEGDELCKIHDAGIYINENSIANENYRKYNYNKDNTYISKIEKRYVLDGDFVKRNDLLFVLDNATEYRCEKDGFIDFAIPSDNIRYGDLIYTIRDNDNERINLKFINEPKISKDEFTNSKIIEWSKVSSFNSLKSFGITSFSDDGFSNMLFTFNYNSGNDYIVFHFEPKKLRLKPNDQISFLFENKAQISFLINTNPISTINGVGNKIIEVKSIITKSELELFATQDFKKWKLTLVGDNKEILGGEKGCDANYKDKKNLITVIKKFTQDYIKIVNSEVENYQPLLERNGNVVVSNSDEYCYVYLMQDSTNGYHKIGISNKPKYREKTLQSEKPSIQLIASKKFPIRKIAESFEKSLHTSYSEKRIRGEWFNLSERDVEHLIESLK